MSSRTLSINSQIVASQIFDTEAVIINLGNGIIYTMDGVGADIWRLIEERRNTAFIAGDLARTYDVTAEQALIDVGAIVQELIAEDLIVESDEIPAAGPAPRESSGTPAPYVKPILVRESDMRDVLALDPPLPKLDDHDTAPV